MFALSEPKSSGRSKAIEPGHFSVGEFENSTFIAVDYTDDRRGIREGQRRGIRNQPIQIRHVSELSCGGGGYVVGVCGREFPSW